MPPRGLLHSGRSALAGLAGCLLVLPGASGGEISPPPSPPSVTAQDGTITVTSGDLEQARKGPAPLISVVFPDGPPAPVLGDGKDGPAHRLLRRLFAAGRAAGNTGDLYENRDRAHSLLPPDWHPQLTQVRYDRALGDRGEDYGAARGLLFDAPLIGNSSTALTGGLFWRSQARLALTSPGGPERLYRNYLAGQIHIYPEHRDHDPEYGDLFPANTPYMLVSQGSSGSDLAHLEALAMILAAFRPDTKAFLQQNGLTAATVQMVYRRARAGVANRDAYLTGAAHPSVFRAEDIALERMVRLASAIAPEAVPPMVRLRVLEETGSLEGVDHFGETLGEVLFDTPSAIARVWRSRTGRRSMTVTAADTLDPNGRDLRFDWVVLRGDPGKVTITPLTPDGQHVHIAIDWQTPGPVPGAPDLQSGRIDIGVFAGNGVHDSAPAFISVLLPRHETRHYRTGADGRPVVQSINRQAPEDVYADPAIFPVIPWLDIYHHDAGGQLTGWTRHHAGPPAEGGGDRSGYDAQGRRLTGLADTPAISVDYLLRPGPDGRPYLEEQGSGDGSGGNTGPD